MYVGCTVQQGCDCVCVLVLYTRIHTVWNPKSFGVAWGTGYIKGTMGTRGRMLSVKEEPTNGHPPRRTCVSCAPRG